jgi:pimeloyl-ACP methyl ester carboxylesterase
VNDSRPDQAEAVLSRSADGTPVVAYRQGSGPDLVLLHGALSDHATWDAVVPFLRDGHTLWSLERRGHGASVEASPYAPQREVEDVAALIETVGAPVDILGHSSGAILALMAAQARLPVRRLVFYEPPLDLGPGSPLAPGLAEHLRHLCDLEDFGGAVAAFLREGPGSSEAEIERLKAGPRWPVLCALARTAAYDAELAASYNFDPGRLARLQTPTLLLVGGDSPARSRAGAEALAAVLPRSRLSELPGQRHFALFTAPRELAAVVHDFLMA